MASYPERSPASWRSRASDDKRFLPLALMVEAAEQPCCSIILERFHAAQEWVPGILAGAVHAVIELSITLSPRCPRGKACVMSRAGWPHIDTVKLLMDKAVSAKRVARTAWSPWWTTVRSSRLR